MVSTRRALASLVGPGLAVGGAAILVPFICLRTSGNRCPQTQGGQAQLHFEGYVPAAQEYQQIPAGRTLSIRSLAATPDPAHTAGQLLGSCSDQESLYGLTFVWNVCSNLCFCSTSIEDSSTDC